MVITIYLYISDQVYISIYTWSEIYILYSIGADVYMAAYDYGNSKKRSFKKWEERECLQNFKTIVAKAATACHYECFFKNRHEKALMEPFWSK